MFQRIVVPLDGSSLAEEALPIAAHLARSCHATLILMQVAQIPPEYSANIYESYISQMPVFPQKVLEIEQSKAHAYLDLLAKAPEMRTLPIQTQVLTGGVAQAILDGVHEQQADLIVLSSHGRSGFTRWVLGSIAQKVAWHSSVPVLLLRENPLHLIEAYKKAASPPRIMVALDGSPFAEAALLPAANLAAALAAPKEGMLHLAQIIPPPPAHNGEEAALHAGRLLEHRQQEVARYLSQVADTLSQTEHAPHTLKIDWSFSVKADVADALIRMAELGEETGTSDEQGYEGIAIATHGRGGIQRWMVGSVTGRVLEKSRLPLLIVRPPAQ